MSSAGPPSGPRGRVQGLIRGSAEKTGLPRCATFVSHNARSRSCIVDRTTVLVKIAKSRLPTRPARNRYSDPEVCEPDKIKARAHRQGRVKEAPSAHRKRRLESEAARARAARPQGAGNGAAQDRGA